MKLLQVCIYKLFFNLLDAKRFVKFIMVMLKGKHIVLKSENKHEYIEFYNTFGFSWKIAL